MTRSIPAMGTIVTIEALAADADALPRIERAFDWIRQVEATCTRFEPDSEAMRLTAQVGTPVMVSDILFEAVRFAVAVAEASGGAFDPTVGHTLQARGFNRHYRTGEAAASTMVPATDPTFRDVHIDAANRTITLLRPVILDLGAVAKGLAIDLAARELAPLADFVVDAGGDLYLAGRGRGGQPWRVGIRHPREDGLLRQLTVTDAAVCTSGDYERPAPDGGDGHHLIDARTGVCARTVSSATVVAPTAMVADAFATAAFVLGPVDGIAFLEAQDVEGLIVSASLEQHATRGFEATFAGPAILRHAERPADHPAGRSRGRRRRDRRRPADRTRTA